MDILHLNDTIRICVENNDVFFQEYRNGRWNIVAIPVFYFRGDEKNPYSKDYVHKDTLNDIEEFFAQTAPWVNNITVNPVSYTHL